MPATDRLAKQVFELATDIARTTPNPETYKLVRMTANMYYGTQLGLAFINRGAEGVRARQLLDDYESSLSWMNASQGHM